MSALILALIAGAVVGLALGAPGGGGSALAVPPLIYLLGFTPAAATTAVLIIVTATSLTALYAHARTGNVRRKAGTLFATAGLLPAAVAGAAAARLAEAGPDRRVRRRRRTRRRHHAALGRPRRRSASRRCAARQGCRHRTAVGSSLLVISANSLASLTTRGATTAGIDWAVTGPFGAAILGAWDGKRLAAKITGGPLRRAFAVALLTVTAFMLADALT